MIVVNNFSAPDACNLVNKANDLSEMLPAIRNFQFLAKH